MQYELIQKIRYGFIQVLGALFIIVGLFGVILPILPGLPVAMIGVLLITMYNPPLHRALHRFLQRYKRLYAFTKRIERGIERVLGKPPNHVAAAEGDDILPKI